MSKSSSAFPGPDKYELGLSKREYAAILILQGLASNTPNGMIPSVSDAVGLADRLFKQLDNTGPST